MVMALPARSRLAESAAEACELVPLKPSPTGPPAGGVVAFAAEQAKIKDDDVRVVPEPKNFIEQLMEQLSGSEDEDTGHIRLTAGQDSLVNLAAPYLEHLDPRRTAAVISILRQLQILQTEGVALTMPGILTQP